MSMYHMVHGATPYGPVLVSLLNLVQEMDPGRYRDAFVEARGDSIVIRLHTRNGGGNRECWCDGDEHYCNQAAIASMQAHPWYLEDRDGEFDSTYADFYFAVDPGHAVFQTEDGKLILEALVQLAGEPVDMPARWQAALDAIKGGS